MSFATKHMDCVPVENYSPSTFSLITSNNINNVLIRNVQSTGTQTVNLSTSDIKCQTEIKKMEKYLYTV